MTTFLVTYEVEFDTGALFDEVIQEHILEKGDTDEGWNPFELGNPRIVKVEIKESKK